MRVLMYGVVYGGMFCYYLRDLPWLVCVGIVAFTVSAFCFGAAYGINEERTRRMRSEE